MGLKVKFSSGEKRICSDEDISNFGADQITEIKVLPKTPLELGVSCYDSSFGPKYTSFHSREVVREEDRRKRALKWRNLTF
jgi:hypothetical protein